MSTPVPAPEQSPRTRPGRAVVRWLLAGYGTVIALTLWFILTQQVPSDLCATP